MNFTFLPQVVGLAQKSMMHERCADANCPHGCTALETLGPVEVGPGAAPP